MLNLVRRCITSLLGSDDLDVRVQQVSYNGKVGDAEIWAPYGMSYNLPDNCLCLYMQIGGDSGNLVVLPDRSQDRVKNLKSGEVAFFNPLTKTRTIYRENGDMEIVVNGGRTTTISGDDIATVSGKRTTTISGDDVTVVNGSSEVTVSGTMDITVTGDVDISTSGKVDITASGDVDVKASNVNIDASVTNLGIGGAAIARAGDPVSVNVTGGSSAGTHSGTITSGGANTSI